MATGGVPGDFRGRWRNRQNYCVMTRQTVKLLVQRTYQFLLHIGLDQDSVHVMAAYCILLIVTSSILYRSLFASANTCQQRWRTMRVTAGTQRFLAPMGNLDALWQDVGIWMSSPTEGLNMTRANMVCGQCPVAHNHSGIDQGSH